MIRSSPLPAVRTFALLLAIAASGWIVPAASAQDRTEPRGALVLSEDYLTSGRVTRQAFSPMTAAARGSVVQVLVEGKWVAFGTIVEADGIVITKASELIAGKVALKLADNRTLEARILAVDEDNDMAMLQVSARNLKPVRWDDAPSAAGQWVATQGISAIPDAVGIVSSPLRTIPRAQPIIGVEMSTEEGAPARFSRVTANLGAAKADLKAGDLVLAIDAKPIETAAQLRTQLMQYRDGQTVNLRIRRATEEFEAKVKLTSRAAPEAARALGNGRNLQMNSMGSGVSRRADEFESVIQHDTVLEPFQCGGPLLNLDGKAVGINIARAGRDASYALPTPLVKRIIGELKAQVSAGQGYQETTEIVLPATSG